MKIENQVLNTKFEAQVLSQILFTNENVHKHMNQDHSDVDIVYHQNMTMMFC